MPKGRLITAIDIGSSKICTLMAQALPERVSVIGVSNVPSQGIKKGVVVDIDDAVGAIADSLEEAERMAGVPASRAFVGVNGKHISSLNSHAVVAVAHPEKEITDHDIERVTEAAQAISIPSSREIIHVLPRGYVVDGQDEIRDPRGMSGVRLEVETNIISGSAMVMRNLVKCVEQVGVEVQDLVFTGVAAAQSVLTDTERELGTLLVDIGGGTTGVTFFTKGNPCYCAVLPLGGQNVTNDLAVGLRVSLEDAEKIKRHLSHIMSEEEEKEGGKIDISELGLKRTEIPRRKVKGIIEARLSEIFKMIREEIKKARLERELPAGMVITGGGAQTYGLEEVAEKTIRLPLRMGEPGGATGLIDEVQGPDFAVAIGLLLFGASFPSGKGWISGEPLRGVGEKVLKWVKSFLP